MLVKIATSSSYLVSLFLYSNYVIYKLLCWCKYFISYFRWFLMLWTNNRNTNWVIFEMLVIDSKIGYFLCLLGIVFVHSLHKIWLLRLTLNCKRGWLVLCDLLQSEYRRIIKLCTKSHKDVVNIRWGRNIIGRHYLKNK